MSQQRVACARAARLEFGEAYHGGISDFRRSRVEAMATNSYELILPELKSKLMSYLTYHDVATLAEEGTTIKENGKLNTQTRKNDTVTHLQIMARCRPLVVGRQDSKLVESKEIDILENINTDIGGRNLIYDSVTVEHANDSVIAHDGRVHRDGRTLYLIHSRFNLDLVFGQNDSDEKVFEESLKKLVDGMINKPSKILPISPTLNTINNSNTMNRPPEESSISQANRATLLLFGQTGTGKTHTAFELIKNLDHYLQKLSNTMKCKFSAVVRCIELAGRKGEEGFDLLQKRRRVKLLEDSSGNVRIRFAGKDVGEYIPLLGGSEGGSEAQTAKTDPEESTKGDLNKHFEESAKGGLNRDSEKLTSLLSVFLKAKQYRLSECTQRNAESSRSHAIFDIHLLKDWKEPERKWKDENPVENENAVEREGKDEPLITRPLLDDPHTVGFLRIVDLAGSERNYETTQHNIKLAQQGGGVNFTLQSLKECIRLKNKPEKSNYIPYRRAKLTHILRDCFESNSVKTIVLGTLSPTPMDVEHTLNTLQHLVMMRGCHGTEETTPAASSSSKKQLMPIPESVQEGPSSSANSTDAFAFGSGKCNIKKTIEESEIIKETKNESKDDVILTRTCTPELESASSCSSAVSGCSSISGSSSSFVKNHSAANSAPHESDAIYELKTGKPLRSKSPNTKIGDITAEQAVGVFKKEDRDMSKKRIGKKEDVKKSISVGVTETFSDITGRGSALHSKLQDADQKMLHAFKMTTTVGGSIMKKYEPENLKIETFIDARYHRELLTKIEEDVWYYSAANREVIHPLQDYQERKFTEIKQTNPATWDKIKVREWLRGVVKEFFITEAPPNSACEVKTTASDLSSADASSDNSDSRSSPLSQGSNSVSNFSQSGEDKCEWVKTAFIKKDAPSQNEGYTENAADDKSVVESSKLTHTNRLSNEKFLSDPLPGMCGHTLSRLGSVRLKALLGEKLGIFVSTRLAEQREEYAKIQKGWHQKNARKGQLSMNRI